MTTRARTRPELVIEPRALDVATAASVYALGETTLRELIEHHGFPHVRIGRRIVVPVAQADAWMAARSAGSPIEVAS